MADVTADTLTTASPNPVTITTTPNGGGGDEKKFTQADLDRHLRERETRDENAARRKVLDGLGIKTEDDLKTQLAELATLRTSQMSEQEKAKAELADANKRAGDLKAQLAEFETVKASAAEYETVIKAQVKTLTEGLAPHLLELLEKMTPAEQLAYLNKNAATLKKKTERIPPTPPGGGGGGGDGDAVNNYLNKTYGKKETKE